MLGEKGVPKGLDVRHFWGNDLTHVHCPVLAARFLGLDGGVSDAFSPSTTRGGDGRWSTAATDIMSAASSIQTMLGQALANKKVGSLKDGIFHLRKADSVSFKLRSA